MGMMKPKTPKAPKPPDPATITVGPDSLAKQQAELERRRRGRFYSGYQRPQSAAPAELGGAGETVG